MKTNKRKARNRATPRPARRSYTVLHQLVQLIPAGLPDELAREAGADIRKFSCTSHVISLIYGHLSRSASLNEICDAAKVHEPEVNRIRRATAPKRNTLSHANRTRDPSIAEKLYWEVFRHLQEISPGFGRFHRHDGFLSRLKREIFAIDSTTLKLSLSCMDWARHRRKKAAAKTHMRLNVGTMLPTFAVVDKASHHDSKHAAALCGSLKDGDVLLADRAYLDFLYLHGLTRRGVTFVLREKENSVWEKVGETSCKDIRIIADETVRPAIKGTAGKYPEPLRRVTAIVEVDGKDTAMTFITNNFKWSPRTIAELYRTRWAIEVFFKEIKQTLQLTDFVGYNENAVKWQVWIGLLVHLLLRFLKHVSKWGLSFSRLAGILRSAVWLKTDLRAILELYGTAGCPKRPVVVGDQLYLQGFEPFSSRPVG